MAKREVVTLNETTPQLEAPQTGDTYQLVRDVYMTTGVITSEVADGASAVGVTIDTENALSTTGAKIASFRNNGVEQSYIDKDGSWGNSTTGRIRINDNNGRFYFENTDGNLVGGFQVGGVVAGTLTGGYLAIGSSLTNPDTRLARMSAGIMRIQEGANGGAFQFLERSADPSAPDADNVVLYAKDNGSGKTGLYARFNTGAVQQIAVEP